MVNKIMANKTVKIEFPRFLWYCRGVSDAAIKSLHTRMDRAQMTIELIVTKAFLTL